MPIPTERSIAKKATRKKKVHMPIRSPIEYDYELKKPERTRRAKLQDLDNRPEKREEFVDYAKIQSILHEQQMEHWIKLENGDMVRHFKYQRFYRAHSMRDLFTNTDPRVILSFLKAIEVYNKL